MITWIMSNLATVIICLALAAVVILVVLNMRKEKKKGKSSCGGSCGCCPMAGACHSASVKKCHDEATIPRKASK